MKKELGKYSGFGRCLTLDSLSAKEWPAVKAEVKKLELPGEILQYEVLLSWPAEAE